MEEIRPPSPRPVITRWDAIRPLRRLLATTVLLPAVLILASALGSLRNHRNDIMAELDHVAGMMAEQAASALATQVLVAAAVDSLLGGRDGESVRHDEAVLHLRLRTLQALAPVQDVLVLDRNGRPLVGARSFPVPSGQDLSDLAWFRAARESEADVVGEVERNPVTGLEGIPFAHRRRMAGGFAGTIVVTGDPAQFHGTAGPHAARLLGFEALLQRQDGAVLAHYPPGRGGSPPDAGWAGRLEVRHSAVGQPLLVQVAVSSGELIRRWLYSLSLILGVGLPVSAALFGTTLLALRRARRAAEADLAWQEETDRREAAEAQLARAQRLESLGQLTGGVAHDFNNLLQVIVSGLAVLDRRPEPGRQAAILEAMRQAASRGGRLTQQLLAFARRQALTPAPLDLPSRIAGMRELLERSLRQDITLRLALPPGLWPLHADATQLEVAILNLAVNARDAMPRGGTLGIAARNEKLPPGDPSGLEGEFVRVTVSDTGLGMAPEILARVFEPFFTTKAPGQGTGLGLAQVYGFARQSGGAALVESLPGKGTAVHLLLPRAECLPSREPGPGEDRLAEAERKPTRRLHVLVVEDNDEVGALASELLGQLGHVANRVRTPEAALGALANGRSIDLLFTDVVMPGARDGLDLVREARQRRPGLPVLLTSGYAEAPARAALAGLRLLRKPYEPEELWAAIVAVMAEGKAAPQGSEAAARWADATTKA